MMAETNKAIACERRQWYKLSQASGVVGGFIGIVCSLEKRIIKSFRARSSAKAFNPLI